MSTLTDVVVWLTTSSVNVPRTLVVAASVFRLPVTGNPEGVQETPVTLNPIVPALPEAATCTCTSKTAEPFAGTTIGSEVNGIVTTLLANVTTFPCLFPAASTINTPATFVSIERPNLSTVTDVTLAPDEPPFTCTFNTVL